MSFAPNALGQATQAGSYATAASYFPNGALKQFTYGNGLVHTLTLNARQLPERSRDALGTNVALDDTYDYDHNGNVAGISDALPGQPGNRDMAYDALDRLTGVTAGVDQGGNGVFAYDPLDNIRQLDQGPRTGRHQYDATNRLSALKNAAGTTLSSYTHDLRGNLASRTEGGTTHTFTFDEANRLRSTTLGASSYDYDGLGRRTRETSNGLATYYQHNRAGQLLYAQDGKQSKFHGYVYLSGSLVAKRSVPVGGGAASVRYQHTDGLGSLVAVSDEAGTVVRRERMTAYGAWRCDDGSDCRRGTWVNCPRSGHWVWSIGLGSPAGLHHGGGWKSDIRLVRCGATRLPFSMRNTWGKMAKATCGSVLPTHERILRTETNLPRASFVPDCP